jgi:putative DNA primase/helicase
MEIPKQLNKFRFVKVKAHEKGAFEKDWQGSRNYPAESTELAAWLEHGGNYGIIGGPGNLLILDWDDTEFFETIKGKLPQTFTVRTGSGKYHSYFVCKGAYNRNLSKSDKHLVDVQADKKYVVAPGSIHPSGNVYGVIDSSPIAEITLNTLEEILPGYKIEETKPLAEQQGYKGDLTKIFSERERLIYDTQTTKGEVDRSRIEFRLVVSLVRKGCDFTQVDSIMQNCAIGKWRAAHNGYRDITYNKAVAYVQKQQAELMEDYIELDENDAKQYLNLAQAWIGNQKEGIWQIKLFLEKKYKFLAVRDEIYIYEDGIYLQEKARWIIKSIVESIVGKEARSAAVDEIIGHIHRSNLVFDDPFEKYKKSELVCVNNGVLNVLTGEFKEHNPNDYFLTKIPIDYVPEQECPLIMSFLRDIIKEDNIPIIQEMIGYCMYREHFIHKAFMLYGSGNNGKSTFISLLKAFLGESNCVSISLQELSTSRFKVAELYGKLANLFADIPPQGIENSAYFKMLTGCDLITAEKKHRDPFSFQNYAKQIFSANTIPKTEDESDAYFRRWIILNFERKFTDEDVDIKILPKISTQTELSGMLNFGLAGLKRLLEKGRFSGSKSIDEIRKEYIRQSDSIAAFCMEYIEETYDQSFILKTALYEYYASYCREMRISGKSELLFARDLRRHIRVCGGRTTIDGKERQQVWFGIRVANQGNQANHSTSIFPPIYARGQVENSMVSLVCLADPLPKTVEISVVKQNTSSILLEKIRQMDKGEGVEISKLGAEDKIQHLLEAGSIFSPRPGFVKVLE